MQVVHSGAYLDQVLQTFSGYVAVDELYDGRSCVLAITDNHTFRRLLCRVLDHDATQQDVVQFLEEFRQCLQQRGLELCGITTDGSNLYPAAVPLVFGAIPHQVCRFHVIASIAKAAREAAVALYKMRVSQLPKLKGGRPRKGKPQQRAQQIRQQREQLLELYRHRYDLVAREPDPEKQQKLLPLLAAHPELEQVRHVMQQVYQLYLCPSSAQAAAKLSALRQQTLHLPQALGSALNGPCIEKSLLYLDHPLLPSTSNAVERSNRCHRKMQKSVYRVRAQQQLRRRLALDMLREHQISPQQKCLLALHEMRAAA